MIAWPFWMDCGTWHQEWAIMKYQGRRLLRRASGNHAPCDKRWCREAGERVNWGSPRGEGGYLLSEPHAEPDPQEQQIGVGAFGEGNWNGLVGRMTLKGTFQHTQEKNKLPNLPDSTFLTGGQGGFSNILGSELWKDFLSCCMLCGTRLRAGFLHLEYLSRTGQDENQSFCSYQKVDTLQLSVFSLLTWVYLVCLLCARPFLSLISLNLDNIPRDWHHYTHFTDETVSERLWNLPKTHS